MEVYYGHPAGKSQGLVPEDAGEIVYLIWFGITEEELGKVAE